ncbi:sulfotransferase [Mucilaginibacter sp. UYCu711]|uniref:sulfotransferase n=1 Tax=Mucilaginibacter sp. UYCu711 TaxID=3156339 RepID=UPI003D25DCAA
MFNEIIDAENVLNNLLPATRLQKGQPAPLFIAAKNWSQLVWEMAEQLGPIPLSAEQISRGINLVEHPVFVCGVHRSGTTLVRNLLDGHPQLVVLPSEGTYYTNLEHKLQQLPQNKWAAYLGTEWLRRLANPINQQPYWLLGRTSTDTSPYVDFARYLLAWWQALPHTALTTWPHQAVMLAYASATNNLDAKLWVDKTPTNERFVERIREEFPSALVIHVVREPVATLTSRRIMEPAISLRLALKFLRGSYQIAIEESAFNNGKFLLLKYEQLCDDPGVIINELTDFLEIENSASLTNATVAGIAATANSSFNGDTVSGAILKPGQHRQKEVFTANELRLITASISNAANKLGYKMPDMSLVTKLFLRLKLLLS